MTGQATTPRRARSSMIAAVAALVCCAALSACSGEVPTAQNTPGLPAEPAVACTAPDGSGKPSPPLLAGGMDDVQLNNAKIIVETGKEMGVDDKGRVIVVAMAIQEFNLRPTDAKIYATAVYGDLLKVENGLDMALWQWAQSARPNVNPLLLAPYEVISYQIVGYVEGIVCSEGNPNAEKIIEAASKYLGMQYSWGGGDWDGPTVGDQGLGFDCSGLTAYAYNQAGIRIPRNTKLLWKQIPPIYPAITDRSQIQRGDLLMFATNGNVHHVGISLGIDANGKQGMIHAPDIGDVVKIEVDLWASSYYDGEFIGALRPLASIPGV